MHASFADNKDGHTNQGEVLTCARPSGLPQAVMAFVPGGTTDLHLQWASKGGGDAQPDGRHPTQEKKTYMLPLEHAAVYVGN